LVARLAVREASAAAAPGQIRAGAYVAGLLVVTAGRHR
jgi:hypothetical protein